MGEFDISGDLESKRPITKNIKRVIVHRQYDPATFENDLALLEMDSPVQFDTHIGMFAHPVTRCHYRNYRVFIYSAHNQLLFFTIGFLSLLWSPNF